MWFTYEYLVLWARYSPAFVERELIPEIKENCARYGIYSQTAYEAFEKDKFAANSLYFHHQYAEQDIPIGKEYEAVAYSVGGKIQPESIQRCPSKVLCFFTSFRTQPYHQASKGHHELSLIQFEQGIPAIIDGLSEITERRPLNTSGRRYVYLGSESVLQKCVREQEAETAAAELLESFGVRDEKGFGELSEEKASAIYERIKRLTVEQYGLEERYAEKILWEGLRDLRWNSESKK